MWHRRSIELYLADKKMEPAKVAEIKTRMDEIANTKGEFDGGKLDYVLGEELSPGFMDAWETNPRYQSPTPSSF